MTNKRKKKRNNFWAIVGALAAIIIPFIIYALQKSDSTIECLTSCPYIICKNNCDKEYIPDQAVNRTPLAIRKEEYISARALKKMNLEEYSSEKVSEIQKQTFYDALEKLSITNQGLLNTSKIKRLMEADNLSVNEFFENRDYLDNFILIYQEGATYQCNSCEYAYSIELLSPKDKQYQIPEDIRTTVYKYLEKEGGIPRINLDHQNQMTIDLSNIFVNLINNAQFNKEMLPLIEKHKNVFNFLDDESALFLEKIKNKETVIHFPRGSYYINSLSRIIINNIYQRLEELIYQKPDQKIEVICVGYTDASKILAPISYNGMAQSGNEPIRMDEAGLPFIQPEIKNNLELSFARAYEGASYFNERINKELRQKGKVSVFYQGKGVAYQAQNPWQKRRIEFIIRNKS